MPKLRTYRRGMVDLIVMIVMIVFLLSMAGLAFFAYDKAHREEAYLAGMRGLPQRQQAELDATRARLAQVSETIGFRGDGAYSSPEVIREMMKDGGSRLGGYYAFKSGADQEKMPGASGSGGIQADKNGQVQDVERKNVKLYTWNENSRETVLGIIAKQDRIIQELVGKHIPEMKRQAEMQRKWRDQQAAATAKDIDTEFKTTKGEIEDAERKLREAYGDAIDAENVCAENLSEEQKRFEAMDGPAVRQAREEESEAMRATVSARRDSAEAQERFHNKASRRVLDDSRDADGYVFMVDERSGWVWINIGQRSDVRLHESFQVLRPDSSRASETPVAEIRVKEILKGNIARCRVDAVEDPDSYPQQGDIIRNPNFNDRQYFSFCLVGKFGGEHSLHTRQELIDKLVELGFRIVSRIESDTDAAILGGDWISDPIYENAVARGLNFEKFTEREILYFLGLDGPDAKD